MSNIKFYKDLPYIEDFSDVTNDRYFKDIPVDWSVIVTDVKNSTIAVEEGRYKEVNFVGACCVSAVLNLEKYIDFPFVFGGDGATILIPPEYLDDAKDVLRDTKRFAREEFNLDIRIGCVPVIDILRTKTKIRITKMKVAENFFQAVFKGGGLEEAENLVKGSRKYEIRLVEPKRRADFEGLQCIWQNFPSKKGEVVSLLVKANDDLRDTSTVYMQVMKAINKIYGTKEDRFPIRTGRIRIRKNIKKAHLEAILESYAKDKNRHLLFVRNLFQMALDWVQDKLLYGIDRITFNAYKNTIIQSIDSEKFDDMLRMVISGTEEQRHQLLGFLEEKYQQGYLAYGLHSTKSVYMTCLFFERKGQQVHFVDGANGGYTLAAKDFKNRIKWQKVYMKAF